MEMRKIIFFSLMIVSEITFGQNYTYDFYRYSSDFKVENSKLKGIFFESTKYSRLNDSILMVYYKLDSGLILEPIGDSMMHYYKDDFENSGIIFDTISTYKNHSNNVSPKYLYIDGGWSEIAKSEKVAERLYIIENERLFVYAYESIFDGSTGSFRIWYCEEFGIIVWFHIIDSYSILSRLNNKSKNEKLIKLKNFLFNDSTFFPFPIETLPPEPPKYYNNKN